MSRVQVYRLVNQRPERVALLGARNRALDDLVTELPPTVVADALGHSHAVAFAHQQAAGGTWARYARHSPSRPAGMDPDPR